MIASGYGDFYYMTGINFLQCFVIGKRTASLNRVGFQGFWYFLSPVSQCGPTTSKGLWKDMRIINRSVTAEGSEMGRESQMDINRL